MRVESLRYFLEVSRRGSFTRAADELYLTQQGLSRAIRVLEKDLGVKLFKRSTKHVSLTESGETLIPFAEAIVEKEGALRTQLALKALSHNEQEEAPEIAASRYAANAVYQLMSDKIEQWGLADASIIEVGARLLIKELTEGSSSTPVLVLATPDTVSSLQVDERIIFEPIFTTSHVISCTRDFFSPRRKVVSAKELSEMPIAYYSDPTINRLVEQMFGNHPPKNVVHHSSSWNMVRKAAIQGRAVMISDSFTEYMLGEREGMMTLRVKEALTPCFGFVISTVAEPSAAQMAYVRTFADMIRTECRSYVEQNIL